MIISAKFKGKDGSMGYSFGKKYELEVTIPKNKNHVRIECKLVCNCRDCEFNPPQIVEYTNILTFLQNWTDIESTN